MNKITKLGVILIILSFSNTLFSQSRADFQKVEKLTVNSTQPTISPDHNAADVPTAEQRKSSDMKVQLVKAKAELEAMITYAEKNPSIELTTQISEYRDIVSKLEKALGIN